jgi:hypothetical protein
MVPELSLLLFLVFSFCLPQEGTYVRIVALAPHDSLAFIYLFSFQFDNQILNWLSFCYCIDNQIKFLLACIEKRKK